MRKPLLFLSVSQSSADAYQIRIMKEGDMELCRHLLDSAVDDKALTYDLIGGNYEVRVSYCAGSGDTTPRPSPVTTYYLVEDPASASKRLSQRKM